MKKDWKTLPMGQLCSIASGKSDTKDAVENGPYAFFDRSRTIKRSSRFLYDCDALIIPGEGTEFLPKQFSGKFDLHQRAYALFDFSPEINVRFLYYFLHYFSDYFPRVAVGATVKSLRRRHFEQLPVSFTSISVQKRIVTILDKIFHGINKVNDNTNDNLSSAYGLFSEHLKFTFSEDGPEWIKNNLGNCCTIQSGAGFPEKFQGSMGQLYPFYKVSDMNLPGNETTMVTENNSVSENTRTQLHANIFTKGSVIFPKVGGAIATNKKRVITKDSCVDNNVMGVTAKSNVLSSDLLYYIMMNIDIYQLSNKANPPSIRQSAVENWEVSYPRSLIEQNKLALSIKAVRDKTKKLEAIYQHKLRTIFNLKKSFLHKAFAGELLAQSVATAQEVAE